MTDISKFNVIAAVCAHVGLSTLLGWIEKKEALQLGPKFNQIISEKKIVCTHLVGGYSYEWNNVQCSDCHPYTS